MPLGISIDSSNNKIYWTKLSKIQRTNLAGRSVTDVVTGLMRPSDHCTRYSSRGECACCSATPQQNQGIGIFDTDVTAGRGLVAEVYVPGVRLTRIPNFDTLTPFRTFSVANIDVPRRRYDQGFPELGVDVLENFAIRLRGRLRVQTAGNYTFELNSDDGSKLYIDGNLVVDNDGLHGMSAKRGSVRLTAGNHDVEIGYFQGPRYEIGLQWSGSRQVDKWRSCHQACFILRAGQPKQPGRPTHSMMSTGMARSTMLTRKQLLERWTEWCCDNESAHGC